MDMQDNEYGYIALTKAYLEDDDESVFTPAMWFYHHSKDECYGPYMALSEEGEEFVRQWLDDRLLGYDLCYGRAKGLAARYSQYDAWNEIVANDDLRIGPPVEY